MGDSGGTVVAVSEASTCSVSEGVTVGLAVKVGDAVLYGQYSGTEISLNHQEYLIMREEDVLGIVD